MTDSCLHLTALFPYQAGDGLQTSNAATVTLTINNPNAPVAVADSYSVERNNEFDADASTGVLANDTDADGDTLTASLATGTTHGTLTLNSDGSFSYVPSSNYTGSDSFTYTASDGVSTSSAATVTLTISGSPPVANDDSFAVLENHQLFLDGPAVLGNDYSPDNMSLTATQLTSPSHGTLSFTNAGSFSYTPTTGYVGTDSFTYDDSDGGLTSNAATVTINVKASNTTPTASNLSYTLAHDTSLSTDSSSGLLSGGSDADGDALTPTLVGNPTHGTLTLTRFYGDGSFTYTPNAGFSGTDSFTYQLTDYIGTSNTATVTLTVTNTAPTANPDSYSVLTSGSTSISAATGVLANDTDDEGDALTAVLVSPPAHGSMMLSSDGSFTFMPSGFTGSDSFTYKAYDGVNYSSPVTVALTGGPTAAAQEYGVTHDQTLAVDAADGLLTGAVDADGDPLTASLATGVSHGSVTVHSDGSFTYTAALDYVGTDSFTYTVSDGTNTSAPATVTLDVSNSVPQAYPQSWDTPQDTALSVNGANGVLASASDDDGDTLTAQLVSGTSSGILQLGSGGNFTYTPNSGFFGTDSFSYDVTDGIATSAAATVTIDVNEVLSQSNNDFRAVATGDFNNDGNPDFVAANYSTDAVSIFLGKGDGTFQTPVAYSVGRGPLAVVAGNFGNGQQDLAVANSLDNTVTILTNNGSGSFTASQVISVGTDPLSIAAGDFRGTGVEDLAVVNEGSDTVSILQNNGSGTFSVVATVNAGTTPDSVAAGNLNGDGKDDLVVANSGDNNISVLLSDGNDTFGSAVKYAVGSGPTSVAVADLSGDGKAEVAVANGGSNNVSVLLGNGDGTLGAATNYAVGSDPVSVAVGDFDGDGLPDLGVVNHGSNDDTELYNTGGGQFLLSHSIPLGEMADDVAVADFNNDGLTDQMIDAKLEEVAGQNSEKFLSSSLVVSQNGSYAAGYSIAKKQILIWNVDKMSIVRTIKAPEGIDNPPMAFSPLDPTLLAIGGKGVVAIWNIQTGETVQTIKYLDGSMPITSVAFSQNGKELGVGAQKMSDNTFGMIWDIKVDSEAHSLATTKSYKLDYRANPIFNPPIKPLMIANEPSGSTVIAGGGDVSFYWKYDSRLGTYLPGATTGRKGEKQIVSSGLSTDGLYAALAWPDGQTWLYSRLGVDTMKLINSESIKGGGKIASIGFSKSGNLIVVDSANMTSYSIKSMGGGKFQVKQVFQISMKEDLESAISAAITPDYVFVGGLNGTVHVYSTISGKAVTISDKPIVLKGT